MFALILIPLLLLLAGAGSLAGVCLLFDFAYCHHGPLPWHDARSDFTAADAVIIALAGTPVAGLFWLINRED